MVTASDICFFTTTSSRKDNDKTNRIRENCLLILNDSNHTFFTDPTYGTQWLSLKKGLESFIQTHLKKVNRSTIVNRIQLQKFANLENHHDFVISLDLPEGPYSFVFEFKFKSMPQFVSICEKDKYIPVTLAEYWYDEGILDKIIALYPNLKFAKPPREEYIKGAAQFLTKKSKDSFFKQFYILDHEGETAEGSPTYSKKLEICQEGIKQYLERYGNQYDVGRFREKLLKDQPEKIYGIWNPQTQEFGYLQYSRESLTPTKIKNIRLNTRIMLETENPNAEIECFLRWKNTQGICNPAWQVSMKFN